MSMLAATLSLDVRIQLRSRLYTIGVAVAVTMGLAGRFIFDPADAGKLLAVFFLIGTGTTTYIFGASLVLYDRNQGTLHALRVTPLTINAYIASKVLTLSAFSTLECAIVYAIGFWGAPVNPVPMLTGVVFLSLFYTFLGLGQATTHQSLFSFLIPGAMLVTLVLQLPFLYVLGLGPPALWHLLPTQAPLLLMLAASETLPAWQWVYGFTVSILSILLLERWAHHRFTRFVALQS